MGQRTQGNIQGLGPPNPCAQAHIQGYFQFRLPCLEYVPLSIPLQDEGAEFVDGQAEGAAPDGDPPLQPAPEIGGAISLPKSDHNDACQVCHCPDTVHLQTEP